MTEFDNAGKELHEIQKEQESIRLNLFQVKEKLRKIQITEQQLTRYFNPQNHVHKAHQQQLQERRTSLENTIRKLVEAQGNIAVKAKNLTTQFLPFTDPLTNINFKSTDYPFLLFPLRLETRFKSVEVAGSQPIEQLWVRVYPDDCLVDTFEGTPSESEVVSVQKFWVDWVRAGGVETERRGAWRSLVMGSGAGRAAWLIQQYRPSMGTPFPQKTNFDLILTISTEIPLTADEQSATTSFWEAWWRGNGEPAAEQAAYTALESTIGAAQAELIRNNYIPVNLASPPPPDRTYADTRVTVTFLDFPNPTQTETQQQPWSQAARVNIFPERLVLLGYRNNQKVLEQLGNLIPTPLIVGPDPMAENAEQLRLDENGDVVVNNAMRWMVDFDRAVDVGMGFRVELKPDDISQGFDQLIVLGVQLSADETAGQEMLETLFHHHETGTSGFSFIPQGTPTNNTEGAGSGFSEQEDSDDTYDLIFNTAPLTHEPDWRFRNDGQWMAELLGIRLSTFNRTPFARGRDQCEARAMNTALWPATWGYLLESMMAPILDPENIEIPRSQITETTRWFFTNFVSARGLLPAIRIGNQPYGILPITKFNRISWLDDTPESLQPKGVDHPKEYHKYFSRIYALLEQLRADWQQLLPEVAYVGKSGDPHQTLLDVLGLHPSSVEFYQRYAESLEQITNRIRLQGAWPEISTALLTYNYQQSGMALLNRLGYNGSKLPEILEKFFLEQPNKLLGDLIDDQPLSEINPIRAYTDDGRNYIQWLSSTASTSFDALRREAGFIEKDKPRALLYLMLRYALEQGYWDAGLRLFETAGILSPDQLKTARLDPSFINIADPAIGVPPPTRPGSLLTSGKPVRIDQRSESRYEYLYKPASLFGIAPDRPVADYIPEIIDQVSETRYLYEQIKALGHLENTPTARLERLLAEHIDLCTYRLDAWRWGLVNYQLLGMRYGTKAADQGSPAQQGIYLGVFGILEQVKSDNKELTPVELDEELDAIFNPPELSELAPLMRDSTNGGFIHAPSLNHATTAAILRNGYIANATPDNPDLLKVNLSSERVRLAMGVIEGVRNGQTLGALLGYQLERGLHDRHTEAEVDQFIFELRKAFPLVANRFRDIPAEPDDAIQDLEARNVINGYALVNQIKQSGIKTYPFGKNSLPEININDSQRNVINTEVDRVLDIHDAVADLVMAEGVYQAVQGNYGEFVQLLVLGEKYP